jgi:hypothetical protein
MAYKSRSKKTRSVHESLASCGAPKPGGGGLDDKAKPAPSDGITSRAQQFRAEITSAEERPFASVGHGTDYRYKGKGLAGTALVHENEVIHAAFFRLDETEQPEHMASYRNRRHHYE